MIGLNVSTDIYMGGTPGEFDLWPWHRQAEETAQQISARRSFAAHIVFGRELNSAARMTIVNYQRWLKGQEFNRKREQMAEQDRLAWLAEGVTL